MFKNSGGSFGAIGLAGSTTSIENGWTSTYWPSLMMKKDAEVGTVTPGKYADIIAVKGDVLRYISLLQRVDIVIKRGKRVK